MRIWLRPVAPEDGKYIVKWRNSPKVAAHCFDKTPVTEESNRRFYEANVLTGKYRQFIVERVEEDFGVASYPIAAVYLKDMDAVNRRCELCIFTSDDEEWNTESQARAIRLLLEKAFREYGMHKVYSYVFAATADETELMETAGFIREAMLRQEAADLSGSYADVWRMCIFREDFE